MMQSVPSWRVCGGLFLTFARIALFVLGGGFAIVPIVEAEYVRRRRCLTEEAFADLLAVVQVSPGIMAANTAAFVGFRLAGWRGAFSAVAGAAFPSFVIICVVAMFFARLPTDGAVLQGAFLGIRAAVCGLVLSTACRMWRRIMVSPFAWCLAGSCFFGMVVLGVNAGLLIVVCAMAGLIRQLCGVKTAVSVLADRAPDGDLP